LNFDNAAMLRTCVPLLLLIACSDPYEQAKSSSTVHDAREFRCRQDMNMLWGEAERYFALKGEWPPDWDALRQTALDPWGEKYILDLEFTPPRLLSSGPDKVLDTVDDVVHMPQ